MHKLTIAAIAAALGLAWTVLPAGAQDTMKNKAERTGEKIEDKTERAKDKIENKVERAKDKADAKGDTMGEKLDRAVDKTKAKTREMKDKVSNKLDRGDTKNAQQALQGKGYHPGPIDGIHGPRTSAAIRDFQKAEGLTVTGQIDGETRSRLMAQSSAPAPAASPASSTPPAPSSAGSPSAPPAAPEKMERK